jgi:hypothetical protein
MALIPCGRGLVSNGGSVADPPDVSFVFGTTDRYTHEFTWWWFSFFFDLDLFIFNWELFYLFFLFSLDRITLYYLSPNFCPALSHTQTLSLSSKCGAYFHSWSWWLLFSSFALSIRYVCVCVLSPPPPCLFLSIYLSLRSCQKHKLSLKHTHATTFFFLFF